MKVNFWLYRAWKNQVLCGVNLPVTSTNQEVMEKARESLKFTDPTKNQHVKNAIIVRYINEEEIMTMQEFVRTAQPGVFKNINTTAHNLNDECKRQGISRRKRFLQLENGVECTFMW